MPKYRVDIVMTINRSATVYVDADSRDGACYMAELMYMNECPTAPLDWRDEDVQSVDYFEREINDET